MLIVPSIGWASGGAAPWSITFIGESAIPGSVANFGDFTFPGPGLAVACVGGRGSGNATVSSISIGGIATTLTANPSGNANATCIGYRSLDAGGVLNVSAIFSSARANQACAVYLIQGNLSATHDDTDGIQQTSGTSQSRSINIVGGGVGIWAHTRAATSNNNSTWSGAIEQNDTSVSNAMMFTTAIFESPDDVSAYSASVSWASGFSRSMVAASFH